MKFTEEQYQKIVEKYIGNFKFGEMVNDVIGYVKDIDKISYEEAILLALPKSREWAHDKFVEKEKKYIWYLKTNKEYRLTTHGGATQVNISQSTEDKLTESEVIKWGYNPDMFDREEAK